MKDAVLRDSKGRFLKGVSGNEGGRPKKDTGLEVAIRSFVSSRRKGMPGSRLDSILNKITEKAEKGDVQAAKLLFAYGYGFPIQRYEGRVEQTFKTDPGWISVRANILELIEAHPELKERISEEFIAAVE